MDTVTYPQTKVESFIAYSVIPVRIPSDHALTKEFNVTWTPTLLMLDWNGREHHRAVGFLPPDELIAWIMLGIAKLHADLAQFDKALSSIGRLLAEYPETDPVPEAIFVRGVCGYKSSHSPQPLKDAYVLLEKQYPASQWTKRAAPYRLL